ncbi:flagellar export chaperone FliS [Nocardioides perillae]|uniref:Flagellar protein FliS n=1 Tax=Nocardioides perillae TaxID=1119534 RepID=A0A7Y9RYQ3_9ACTN|nr:flagellar export chaperone FliS [Nocardioides perillae]NYG57023.1 flagellar protein FliS [Nocardioides perillae]
MIPTARNAYMQNSVSTASPARLLVMLVDRLVLDVQRALDAQHVDDLPEAHRQLLHAQDIVVELRSTLKPELFAGGQQLASLYDYLFNQLVAANVRKDAALTEHCLGLVRDLADTWKQAALQAAAAPTAASA